MESLPRVRGLPSDSIGRPQTIRSTNLRTRIAQFEALGSSPLEVEMVNRLGATGGLQRHG